MCVVGGCREELVEVGQTTLCFKGAVSLKLRPHAATLEDSIENFGERQLIGCLP